MILEAIRGECIRIPAHCCGITGIKPTSGRVPRTGHGISYAMGATESLTQNGPMARRVEDLFPVPEAISGPDWVDPAIIPMPLKKPEEVDIGNLRVAFHTDNGLMSPTGEIQETVIRAAKALHDAAAMVSESKPNAIDMVGEIDNRHFSGDGRAWVKRMLDRIGTDEYSPFILNRFSEASVLDAADYTEVLELVDVYRSRMIGFMKDTDVILCPASARPAPEPGASFLPEDRFLYSYTSAYNLTGWPAGVLRGGPHRTGCPLPFR